MQLDNYAFADIVTGPSLSDGFFARTTRLGTTVNTLTPFGFRGEVELIDIDKSGSNFLRQAYFQYDTGSWKHRLGRLFLGAGFSTPPPFKLRTVNYPGSPYNLHAWGIQTLGNLSDTTSAVLDISTRSGVAFSDPGSFGGLEASGRIQYEINSSSLAPSFQVGQGFYRVGIDGTYKFSDKFDAYGAVHLAKEGGLLKKIGHLFVGWKVFKGVELHTQIIYRQKQSIWWTNGIRLSDPSDKFSITLDHEHSLVEGVPSGTFVRLQFVY
ncbi:MAG: hypothetical protein H6779_04965 [Candidatus Nomurabacteria bacterium]|nr:hypothetical protein [Candidatus Nomurabacteria bacterium]USN87719.1 MAG: hypothetical protein H6779_04965 [Candidatus Nomurabacteria bacterium]